RVSSRARGVGRGESKRGTAVPGAVPLTRRLAARFSSFALECAPSEYKGRVRHLSLRPGITAGPGIQREKATWYGSTPPLPCTCSDCPAQLSKSGQMFCAPFLLGAPGSMQRSRFPNQKLIWRNGEFPAPLYEEGYAGIAGEIFPVSFVL